MAAPPSNHERQPPASSKRKRKKTKRSRDPTDDTPKAFARLMAFATTGKLPNGLDDPKPGATSKKRKRSAPSNDATAAPGPSATASSTTHPKDADLDVATDIPTSTSSQNLTLLPGEKFSDFSRRVDAAIPISFKGLQRGEDNPKRKKKKKKDAKDDGEAPADNPEEVTEDSYDFDDNGDPLPNHLKPHSHTHTQTHNKSKSRKDRSPSPFAELRQQRGAVQRTINDVVQAPPSLVVPKEKLRDKTKPQVGGLVPKSSGSLARREMLEVERQSVVERYRALMAAKSGGL
ncbi:hypothetical protein TWF696_000836 [Orbilia brochopaga]|uniref:Uncharacterized protein n=1 Tax=Orbilia brochopaga TaxID=3140254 RepID=A0AAV9VCX8_9PEZI